MSFHFRDVPKFADRMRGKSGDELLQEIKQRFNEDSDMFFEPSGRTLRDPFDRQFCRVVSVLFTIVHVQARVLPYCSFTLSLALFFFPPLSLTHSPIL